MRGHVRLFISFSAILTFSNKETYLIITHKILHIMKKLLYSVCLLAFLPAAVQATDPVKDPHGFGTYVVKNLPMYEPADHKPNIANGVKDTIDLYVVSYGDDIRFKQVSQKNIFDGSEDWRNQLLIWKTGETTWKEIYRSARSADNTVAYSAYSNGLFGYGDAAIQLNAYAKMWGSNGLYSDLFDYKREYINTPTGDQVAPTFEATLSYSEDNTQATVTFSNPSEEVFWFIENGSSKSIQFQDTYTFPVADAQSVIVYAVDFDGNMSQPCQVFPQVQTSTVMEEHIVSDTPQKVLVNGQIYILHQGNTYNTQGQIID